MSDAQSDRQRWEARWAEASDASARPPSQWIVDTCRSLPASLVIADIASGVGRHALPLARDGRTVIAVDVVERAVAIAAREPRVTGLTADTAALPLRDASLDLILCVNYLARPLFAVFRRLLRAGGFLVYETYTVGHLALVRDGRAHGPRNPDYMLQPGELASLVSPLELLEYHEELVADDAGERHVARAFARKA